MQIMCDVIVQCFYLVVSRAPAAYFGMALQKKIGLDRNDYKYKNCAGNRNRGVSVCMLDCNAWGRGSMTLKVLILFSTHLASYIYFGMG